VTKFVLPPSTKEELALKARLEALGEEVILGTRLAPRDGKFFWPDLVLPERQIAIEVDGDQHLSVEHRAYDEWRTAIITRLGLSVHRMSNRAAVDGSLSFLQRFPRQDRELTDALKEALSASYLSDDDGDDLV